MSVTVARMRVCCVAVVASLVGCQSWKVEKRPVEAVVASQPNGMVAFTMNDLRWVVLKNPRILNDSVIGTRVGGNTYGKGRTALSASGVKAVETRRFSFLRTAYLGIAAAFIPTLYRLAVVEND